VLVVAIGVGALADDRGRLYGETFVAVLALAVVYAVVALALALAGRAAPPAVFGVLDVGLLVILAHASGGAVSQVRFAFFAVPFLAAMLFAPAATALTSAAVVAGYVTLALTLPSGDVDRQLVFVETIYLSWAGIAAVLLSALLTRRARAINELADVRGRLVAELLDAEDRERRRLADWLHDGAVQNLIVVGQDLHDVERGDRRALARAREVVAATIGELRRGLVALHPGVAAGSGLARALEVMAQSVAHGAAHADVAVDAGAEGPHDQLLLSVARELLTNVTKHAGAHTVRVRVRREPRAVVLEVADDGRGFDPARRAGAVAGGHIGLASVAQRVESEGGRFEVDSRPGAGTRVRVEIPAPRR